jgi:hypothetical protein
MGIDQRVVKAALDAFEADDYMKSKELLQGQIKQAKNDFLKSKLDLKKDIEDQYQQVEPGDEIKNFIKPAEQSFSRYEDGDGDDGGDIKDDDDKIKPKKRLFKKK